MTSASAELPSNITFFDSIGDVLKRGSSQLQHAVVGVAESMQERLSFIGQFFKDPTTVGSFFPSSENLALKMIRHIPSTPNDECRHYLEVGPGTGSFTKHIVSKLGPNDRLDLVELNEEFCKLLRERYADFPNVHIIEASILDWNPDYKYDVVMSGLPLNSFNPDLVDRMLGRLKVLTSGNKGKISFFEYLWIPSIKQQLLRGEDKAEFLKVLSLKEQFFQKHGISDDEVMWNLPPARVRHFEITE